MKVNKAMLAFVYFITDLILLGILLWVVDYGDSPKHPAWRWWVVPLQEGLFIFTLIVNIGVVILMIFPTDWFVDWAEMKLKEIKAR